MAIPKGQTWLIDKMKKLGLKANTGGVCYGLSYMAMQASLADDMTKFKNRLEILSNWQDNKLIDYINNLGTYAKIKGNKEKVQQVIDILAFLHGVDLYFQPAYYNNEFAGLFDKSNAPKKQTAEPVIPILQPVALDKEGKQITHVFSNLNTYSKDDLEIFLKTLKVDIDSIVTPKGEKKNPVSLCFCANSHAINLSYFPESKPPHWLLTDPNNLPPKSFTKTSDLPNNIFNNLFVESNSMSKLPTYNKRLIANIDCYATKDIADKLKPKMNSQYKIFEIKKDYLKNIDKNGRNLLHHAITR